MPPVEFEPTIPAGAGPQTYALGHASTGIGLKGDKRRLNETKLVL
jgi:hypothetical protein